MSDKEVRRAERRWSATNNLGNQCVLLHTQIRAGLVPESEVCLLAGLGLPAARVLRPEAGVDLLDLLDHQDAEFRLRSWLALLSAALSSVEESRRDLRYVDELGDLERALIHKIAPPIRLVDFGLPVFSEELGGGIALARRALRAMDLTYVEGPRIVGGVDRRTAEWLLARATSKESNPRPASRAEVARALEQLESRFSAITTVEVVAGELLPWLLEESDPLGDRVEQLGDRGTKGRIPTASRPPDRDREPPRRRPPGPGASRLGATRAWLDADGAKVSDGGSTTYTHWTDLQ